MCCVNISAVPPPGHFSGRFLTSLGSRQPMLSYSSAQTKAWGDTYKNISCLRYRSLQRGLSTAFCWAFCWPFALDSGQSCPVVPWVCPNDMDWSSWAMLRLFWDLQPQGETSDCRRTEGLQWSRCRGLYWENNELPRLKLIKIHIGPTNYISTVSSPLATHCKQRINWRMLSPAAFRPPQGQQVLYSTNMLLQLHREAEEANRSHLKAHQGQHLHSQLVPPGNT